MKPSLSTLTYNPTKDRRGTVPVHTFCVGDSVYIGFVCGEKLF